MAYIPSGGVSQANAMPYDFANYGQYNAQAYDNSAYADYSNFNKITPFNAWGQLNIWGVSAPPPGMNYGQYTDRLNTLSSRFASYAPMSMAASAASVLGATAFMYSDVAASALHAASNITGSSGLMRASNAFNFMGETFGKANGLVSSAIYAPFQHGLINPASSLIGSFGDDMINVANSLGGRYLGGFNTIGSDFSRGVNSLITKGLEKWHMFGVGGIADATEKAAALSKAEAGIAAGKSLLNANGAAGWLAGKALWAPAAFASTVGGFMATQAILDTAIQGGINMSGVGIQAEQDKIADTFESLSNRVLTGASEYKSKKFATDVAQRIRENSFADATATGVMGKLGISDTYLGRFTGGWSAISEMQNKTANYALMAESGLLTKSNSADEFIKKADAMYAAIAKLGDALGQTTTKAMETARALKSQGISSPAGIANAGRAISTSSGITGYSDNQVLALTGEATEAFRGTIFGADLAFDMANSSMRKISLGANTIGDSAYDKLLYTSRGQDSLQVMNIRATAQLTNASELKSMMIASMFSPTSKGFEFTGKINTKALNAAIAGEDNYITNDATITGLTTDFRMRDQAVQRAAEREMSAFAGNLTDSGRRGMIDAVGRIRGYKSSLDLYEQRYREQGMDPISALNLAKITTADTRALEANYEYFERKQQQLSNYLEKSNDTFYKSFLSDKFTGHHAYTGRYTAALEIAGMAAAGAGAGMAMGASYGIPGIWAGGIAGGVAGAVAGVASNSNFFTGIGNRMGIESDFWATGAGAGSYVGGVAAAGIGAWAGLGAARAAAAGAGLGVPIGLMRASFLTAAGTAVGYGANYLGDKLFTDEYKAAGFNERNAQFLGRATGGGMGVGAIAALGATGAIMAPTAILLGTGAAIYSAWNAYSSAYLTPEQGLTQRKILQDTVSVANSAEALRRSSPSAYADMLERGKAKQTAIDTASLEGYYKRATKEELDTARTLSGRLMRWHAASPDSSDMQRDKGIASYYSYDQGVAGGLNRGQYDLLKDLKSFKDGDLYAALSSIKGKAGAKGKGVIVDSDEEVLLRRIRMSMSGTDSSTKNALVNYLNDNFNFSSLKIIGKDKKTTLFSSFSNYASDQHARNFNSLEDNVTKEIDAANTILNNAYNLKGSAGNIIDTGNISGMYEVLRNAYAPGGVGLEKALENGSGKLAPDLLARLGAYKGVKIAKDSVDNVLQHLSNAQVSAMHPIHAESITAFVQNKSAMLGDNAGLINSYLKSFVGGTLTQDEKIRITTMANNKFENIKDLNVAAALNEIHSTVDAGNLLSESARNNNWTVGQAREKIKSANKLSSVQKNMLLEAMSTYDASMPYQAKAGEILTNISANVFNSNINEAGKQTAEDLAASQMNILSKLDTSIGAMTTAAKELTSAILTGKPLAPKDAAAEPVPANAVGANKQAIRETTGLGGVK